MKRREISERERALWDVYAQGIQPLKRSSSSKRIDPPASEPLVASADTSQKIRKIDSHVAVPEKKVASPKPSRPAVNIEVGARLPGLDNGSWRALVNGRKVAERRIDLHGYFAQEAFEALHSFIMQAHRDAIRCIEIVTGVGSGAEGGVLRRELPHWLDRPDLRPLILGVVKTHRANNGAVRVLLRARRTKRDV